jgi:hypothetical protein
VSKQERLEARVRAVNRANAYAAELYPALRKVFEGLVGKQVVKKEGGLLARVKAMLPELPCTPGLHVYRSVSVYSIAFVVKTCESGEGYCFYHETAVQVGALKGGVLVELSEPFAARADYTADEVLRKREAFEAAERAYREARSELHLFGEHD